MLMLLSRKTIEFAPLDVVTPDPPAATGNVPATNTEELVEYKALFAAVNPVKPVPPLEVANVPPSVIAPDVGVEGVKSE
jgi:hypothetical protein